MEPITKRLMSWRDWRWLSIALSTLLTIPLLMVMVPGHLITWQVDVEIETRDFGWPFVYCYGFQVSSDFAGHPDEEIKSSLSNRTQDGSRSLVSPHSNSRALKTVLKDSALWSDISNWNPYHDGAHVRWLPLGLVVDLVCLILVWCLSLGLVEYFRRRRSGWFQVSILEIFVLGSTIGIFALWIGEAYFRSQRTKTAIDQIQLCLENGSGLTRVSPETPVWLDRVADGVFDRQTRIEWAPFTYATPTCNRIPMFSNISLISIKSPITDAKLLSRIVSTVKPEELRIVLYAGNDQQRLFLETVDTRSIKKLNISGGHIGHEDDHQYYDWNDEATVLSRFTKLEKLTIINCDLKGLNPKQLPKVKRLCFSQITDTESVFPRWTANNENLLELNGFSYDDWKPAQVMAQSLPHLNQGLESLYLWSFSPSTTETVDWSHLRRLKNLKHLDLIGYDRTLAQCKFPTVEFPLLETVRLRNFEIDVETCDWLTSLPNIALVELCCCKVTEKQKLKLEAQLPSVLLTDHYGQ